MTTMASQITNLTVVYSTVYSDTDQRKNQSSVSLAFVWGIHSPGQVNSPHKGPVTRKMFPFDDVIMNIPNPYYIIWPNKPWYCIDSLVPDCSNFIMIYSSEMAKIHSIMSKWMATDYKAEAPVIMLRSFNAFATGKDYFENHFQMHYAWWRLNYWKCSEMSVHRSHWG